MSRSLNKVMLIGTTGKDAELRYTGNGTAVGSFSVATNESYKGADGNLVEKTEWHNIVCWKKLAEVCGEYVKKGKKIYIEGKMQTRTYEKDGSKRYITEIVADKILFLDSKGAENTATTDHSAETSTGEDIPF